ncbi:mediator complex, subunit Med16 [Daldinia sp. FL1419]|nr:mediator complex, subunit Med16 [Daldinia sp. FL1419]
MTSVKMPLILDNPMGGEAMQVDLDDVDDLFGDGAPLALPSRSISKRLRQRLDELRERGSYQGIAWSKAGTIASITPDGERLQLMYIHAKGKDATFALSKPTTISPWESLPGGPLVHLSWSPASPELAVIDAVGRVLILNFAANLNRPFPSRRWDGDPIDDLQAIVGTYWLPGNHTTNPRSPPYTPSYGPAIRNGNGNNYSYQLTPILNTGPLHPLHNKSALICITTTGVLKMFWTQNNGKIEETTLELENAALADDLVTHAAICPDKDRRCIMVALATASKQLCVVQVAIGWSSPKTEGAQNNQPGNQSLTPMLTKRHVAVTSWFQPSFNDSHPDASMQKITHTEMLPPILTTPFNVPVKEWSPTVILTVRSLIPEPNLPYAQEVHSIIDRWELSSDHHQTLHSAFEQQGLRKNSASSPTPNSSRLKKLDPIVVNKIIIGVNLINFGKVLCFSYSDGSVEYRDRFTMAELYREPNLERISSVFESGFSQSGEPSCLQTAFSPTNFSLVQLCEDGKVKWHSINYTLTDIASMNDTQVSALVAAFYISTAQAVAQGANFDDILAVARNFVDKDSFVVEWVKTQVQQMKITVDYTEDAPHDNLIKNNILQVCLSFLNYLGWRGDFQPRKGWGKLSMLALNLRNIIVMITLSNNQIPLGKSTITPLDEPEAVNALAGSVKWSNDLLSWLCDSLFCLFDDAEFMKLLKGPQLDKMTMYLHANNEIALHLVLCSTTRGLLSALCRRIALLDTLSTKAISWYENREKAYANNPNTAVDPRMTNYAALHAAYHSLRQCISSSFVKANEFDKLLTSLGAEIRTAYSTSLAVIGEQAARAANKSQQAQGQNPNAPRPDPAQEAIARARQHCELDMLVLQAPPSSFVSVVNKFFSQDLKEFRARSEVAKLYFGDYSILEIDDGPRSLARRKASGVRVDLFKRTLITRKSNSGNSKSQIPWRKCVRCGNVMEDLVMVAQKPGLSFLLRQQFNCSCGGRMAVLIPDNTN